jgi:DNA-binding CsgD family transcriptional regulator
MQSIVEFSAGGSLCMAALQALKEVTTQLSFASSAEDIGRVLFAISKRFGMTTAILVDMTKLFNRIGPAIVFSSTDRAALEIFDAQRPFISHPFLVRARLSEKPVVMSRVKAESVADGDEGWWQGVPAHLRHTDGLIVPVHDGGALAWYTAFAGREPDLSQRAQSVLSAAVHAGYSQFRQLMDATTPRSPLSPRESECLRWVADGKTDFEVGKILSISPRTVRFHINNAKSKLGVTTRIQAVAKRVGELH